jgi:hypothetical protein
LLRARFFGGGVTSRRMGGGGGRAWVGCGCCMGVEERRADSKLAWELLLGGLRKVEMGHYKRELMPYLIGGGGAGGGCLAAGGRDEGREPVPGVGERSRIFEGCSGSITSSPESDSSV